MTRADVPIAAGLHDEHEAERGASIGVAIDAPLAEPDEAPLVAIEAWDAWTVLGGLHETWTGLLAGRAIDDHTRIAIVRRDGLERRRRAVRLAQGVAARVSKGIRKDAALVVGTSKGSVEDWLANAANAPPGRTSTSDNPAAGVVRGSGLADVSAAVARRLRLEGPRLTVSAACASGLHALIRGAMMIRSGEVRQALVVATEASVHPLFLANFQRLGVLARPGDGCRPFDRRRTGFYMTEAAAAVLLRATTRADLIPSRRSDVRRDPSRPAPVFLDGFAMGGDATHLTGGDADARVLKHLLSRVIDGRRVDLIHAHGTGTELNDATELAAIEATVGDWREPPIVYSHKAALGHSLGASGLLSVVLNSICHATGKIPPNARTTEPLGTRRVILPTTLTGRRVDRSVAIAAGFGGPTAVVSLASQPG